MTDPAKLLRTMAGVFERLDAARERGETDPLRIADAMLGGSYTPPDPATWWELFGLDERPANRAQLEGAWKRWAARNHPDAGGSQAAFRHMRALFERMRDTLPDPG